MLDVSFSHSQFQGLYCGPIANILPVNLQKVIEREGITDLVIY